jgi:hypothetical protein
MTAQNQNQQDATQPQDGVSETPRDSPAKKKFVEPTISRPVDVLEATTFFQGVDSGGTGLNKKKPG